MGRLTRDPEVRYSQGERQMAIARYTLAVDRRGRREAGSDAQQADFINCVAFDRAGEFAEKYFHKGMRVLVSGRIQTGSYTNRDGQTVYTTDVVVDDQEFADSKGASTGNDSYSNQNSQRYSGQGYQAQSRPTPGSAIADGFMNIPDGVDDEGLPFN
jgi:single-strand DNA-binding protein